MHLSSWFSHVLNTRNCEGLCHSMWPALRLLLLLWKALHAIGGIFCYISCLLSVFYCYFMYCSNYSSNSTDISVYIIPSHIFFVHMGMTKDLRLLLRLSSVVCLKSSMSTSSIYTCQSHYCQSMNPTKMNITWFQVIVSMIFLKSLS